MYVTGSNPLSTQDDVAAALVHDGLNVFAWHGATPSEYEAHIRRVLEIGYSPYGGLYNFYDVETGELAKMYTWWVEAESAMSMLFGYQLTGDEAFLTACEKQLDFIDKYFINREHGDWYNNITVDEEGRHIVDGSHGFDKLNAGKCPFHNSHMCFDIIRRVDAMLAE